MAFWSWAILLALSLQAAEVPSMTHTSSRDGFAARSFLPSDATISNTSAHATRASAESFPNFSFAA